MSNELVSEDTTRSGAPSEPAMARLARLEREATPSETYPALGEPLAVEFANTLFTDGGRPLDALTTQVALTRWVQANADRVDPPRPRTLTAEDFDRALGLRAIIRTLLANAVDGDPPAVATVRQLNRFAALVPFTTRLQWTAGDLPEAQLASSGKRRVDALLALIAQSAIDVLGGSGAGRLRRCEAPGCISYYLKDHPRRAWCSPACGNRVRVARHYQRTRRTGA